MAGGACHGGGTRRAAVGEVARTEPVERGDIVDRVLLTGELHAASNTDLTVPRTEVWQLAIRSMAEDGATVKAGDRVLEFDNSAFTCKVEEGKLRCSRPT